MVCSPMITADLEDAPEFHRTNNKHSCPFDLRNEIKM